MESFIIILLVALGILVVLGLVVAYFALHKAPDGFEDHRGFHIKRKPKD